MWNFDGLRCICLSRSAYFTQVYYTLCCVRLYELFLTCTYHYDTLHKFTFTTPYDLFNSIYKSYIRLLKHFSCSTLNQMVFSIKWSENHRFFALFLGVKTSSNQVRSLFIIRHCYNILELLLIENVEYTLRTDSSVILIFMNMIFIEKTTTDILIYVWQCGKLLLT